MCLLRVPFSEKDLLHVLHVYLIPSWMVLICLARGDGSEYCFPQVLHLYCLPSCFILMCLCKFGFELALCSQWVQENKLFMLPV